MSIAWQGTLLSSRGEMKEDWHAASDKKISSNVKKPKRPYVQPQLSRLSLAEARTKLQAEVMPGDAGGQEMLRRTEELLEK
jgi:hypothetical protein